MNRWLTTWDGAGLVPSDAETRLFSTPQASLRLQSVASAQAAELTDGGWYSGVDPAEVPPDGVVQLVFSRDVELERLEGAFRLQTETDVGPSGGSGAIVVAACQTWRPDASCVSLTLSVPLSPGARYKLVLPAGTIYHHLCGATQRPYEVAISGLKPFTFPFKHASFRPGASRFDLQLPHGLSEDVTLARVKAAFVVSPPVEIELSRPSLSKLQMSPARDGAGFRAGQLYSIDVVANGSIRDGFGLPLQASSSRFTTAGAHNFFLDAAGGYNPGAVAVPSTDPLRSTWDALVRVGEGESSCHLPWQTTSKSGCTTAVATDAYSISGASVNGVADVPKALASLHNAHTQSLDGEIFAYVDLGSEALQALALPATALLEPSGLFVETRYQGEQRYGLRRIVSQASEAVTFVPVNPAGGWSRYAVWVTDVATNVPVVGAKCYVYHVPCGSQARPLDVRLLSSKPGTTDQDGLAMVKAEPERDPGQSWHCGVTYGVVESAGRITIVDGLDEFESPEALPTATIITDRSVYKPGETVYLKLYVRVQIGTELLPPPAGDVFKLQVQWSGSSDAVELTATLDSEFGSFNADLTVPADIKYGDHTVRLLQRDPNFRNRQCGAATITVADPRPPTVRLSLAPANGEQVIARTGTVDIEARTTTYAGTAVAGQALAVQFHVEDLQGRAEELTGTLDIVTTGDDGTGVASFALPVDMAPLVTNGQRVQFSAVWVGPTREVVSAEASLLISDTAWEIRLTTSQRQPLPGYEFLTSVTVEDMGSGDEQVGLEAQISLYATGTTGAVPSVTGAISVGDQVGATCMDARTGGNFGCPLALPAVGKFVLVACVLDPSGGPLCSALELGNQYPRRWFRSTSYEKHLTPLGKTEAEWAAEPLVSPAGVSLGADKQAYRLGETASFHFLNPFKNASALLVWGNGLGGRSLVTALATGPQTLQLPIGDECFGGCRATIVVSSPAQPEASPALPVDLATSVLFDSRLPRRIVSQHALDVIDDSRKLSVTVQLDVPVLAPGSEAGLTVTLTDASGNPAAGEVAVFVVDRAFLDVAPHPPTDLLGEFELQLRPRRLSIVSNADRMIGGAAYERSKARDNILATQPRRADISCGDQARIISLNDKDEWCFGSYHHSQWPIAPGVSDAFDLAADAFLDRHSRVWVTDPPVSREPAFDPAHLHSRVEAGGEPMFASAFMDLAEDSQAPLSTTRTSRVGEKGVSEGSRATTASPIQIDAPIPIRSAFETAPLILPALTVPPSGTARVTWTLPDNVGTFVVRAYAASGTSGARFGTSDDAEQVSRNPLSLVPSVPRISRVGDHFSCGVTVTAADPTFSEEVTLSVLASGGLALTSAGSQTVSVDGSRPREVTFNFSAASMARADLVFAVAASETSDALSASVPVLSPQQEIFVATSMPITASEAGTPWTEGLALPKATPGSGSLDLIAGVGYLPAVRAISSALVAPEPCEDRTRYCSSMSVVNSLAALPVLEEYLGEADEAARAAADVFGSSLTLLEEMTDGSGLRSSLRVPQRRSIDLPLTAWALEVLSDAERRPLSAVTAAQTASASRLRVQWTAALREALAQEVDTSRQNGYPFRGYDAVARVRLSLGVADLPGLDADATSLTSMERLVAAAKDGTCGSYCSAATALILLRESPADRDALKLLTDLANQLRATGRTAYLAHDGSAHAQGMSVQALVARGSLLCADRSPIPLLLLQKLANYIAQGGAQWGPGVVGGGGGGGSAGVARIFALAEYDVHVGSDTPDVNFTASSGPVRLLHGRFTPASREALASSTSWQALDSPPAPLVFWARGSGQINVAAGLRFVPTDPPPGPVYRGLLVEMAIRLVVSGNPSGPPLRSCHLGSVVAVTIQVTSPDDIGSSVRVEGWLPAGLEPLDPNVGEGGGGSDGCDDPGPWPPVYAGRRRTSLWRGGWWFCPLWERQTMVDKVTWHSAHGMRAGTVTLSFEAVAVTSGVFVRPPAQALIEMQPEVMGFSAGGLFEVSRTTLTAEQMALPVTPPPIDCPGDGCSGNGVCDVVSGACVCSGDFVGDDCAEASAPLALAILSATGEGAQRVVLQGLSKNDEDWVAAVSSDERVVASASFVFVSGNSGAELTWALAEGASAGSSTVVTVVVVEGSRVTSRQFRLSVWAVDGELVGAAGNLSLFTPGAQMHLRDVNVEQLRLRLEALSGVSISTQQVVAADTDGDGSLDGDELAALEARVASFGGAHDSGGGSGGGMSTGVVAAIAVGAIVGIGAIGVLLWRARCAGSTARCPSDPDGSDGDAGKGGKAPMRDDQALQSL